MLMRYHLGLSVGHSYAHPAPSESDQQSANRSHSVSVDEDEDEEHGDLITIPQCSDRNELSHESAEEDSNDKFDLSDHSLDSGDDDCDSWMDGTEELDMLEEMY